MMCPIIQGARLGQRSEQQATFSALACWGKWQPPPGRAACCVWGEGWAGWAGTLCFLTQPLRAHAVTVPRELFVE